MVDLKKIIRDQDSLLQRIELKYRHLDVDYRAAQSEIVDLKQQLNDAHDDNDALHYINRQLADDCGDFIKSLGKVSRDLDSAKDTLGIAAFGFVFIIITSFIYL